MDGKIDECLYEHNIYGRTYYGVPGNMRLTFNFTYIDNESTCDYSDIKNALLKNPSINATVYKPVFNSSDVESVYFVRNLHINPPSNEDNIFEINFDYFKDNLNFTNSTIYVSKITSDTDNGFSTMNIKYITTNKITNLY